MNETSPTTKGDNGNKEMDHDTDQPPQRQHEESSDWN